MDSDPQFEKRKTKNNPPPKKKPKYWKKKKIKIKKYTYLKKKYVGFIFFPVFCFFSFFFLKK